MESPNFRKVHERLIILSEKHRVIEHRIWYQNLISNIYQFVKLGQLFPSSSLTFLISRVEIMILSYIDGS